MGSIFRGFLGVFFSPNVVDFYWFILLLGLIFMFKTTIISLCRLYQGTKQGLNWYARTFNCSKLSSRLLDLVARMKLSRLWMVKGIDYLVWSKWVIIGVDKFEMLQRQVAFFLGEIASLLALVCPPISPSTLISLQLAIYHLNHV